MGLTLLSVCLLLFSLTEIVEILFRTLLELLTDDLVNMSSHLSQI